MNGELICTWICGAAFDQILEICQHRVNAKLAIDQHLNVVFVRVDLLRQLVHSFAERSDRICHDDLGGQELSL